MSIDEYVATAASIRSEMHLEVACTIEAVEDLRGYLEKLESLLQGSQCEAASTFGYNEISAGFVYLQRCLGGIEELHFNEQLLVKELADQRQCSEAEAQHFLDAQIGVTSEHP